MEGVTFFFDWEVKLMEWIQTELPFFCNNLAQLFSAFGEQLLIIGILGFLFWCYDKDFGKYIGINAICATVWNPLVKNVFLRRRPYMDHATIKCLRPIDSGADIMNISAQGYSFPSGHSTSAASVYGALAVYGKKRILTVLAFLLPLLVGISRFAVGVHYPTDVIFGWALGLFSVALVGFLQKKIKKPSLLYLVIALLGLPGWFYCKSTDFYTGYGLMIGAFSGFLFEARYVNFENTRSVVRSILRLACGGGLYVALNSILKLPFDEDFLASVTTAAFAVRTARYAVVSFVCVGIYPMLFKYTARIGKKKS